MTTARAELTRFDLAYDAAVSYAAPLPYGVPPATDATMRLYDAVGPAMRQGDSDGGHVLLSLLEGAGLLLQDVDQIVADTDTAVGWAAPFNPQTCPPAVLSWTAQIVGESLPVGLSLTDRRTQVAGRRRWRRGTPGGIAAAVAATLTGTKRVVFSERTDTLLRPAPDRPYRFVVIVDKAEMPNLAATSRALAEATPAGMLSTLIPLAGYYQETYTSAYV